MPRRYTHYTDTGDGKDPANRAAYLLRNLELAVNGLLDVSDQLYFLRDALKGTPQEKDVQRVWDELYEARLVLEGVQVALGLPHPDAEPIEEG